MEINQEWIAQQRALRELCADEYEFYERSGHNYPAALDALEAAYAEIERLTHDYAASTKRLIDGKDRLTAGGKGGRKDAERHIQRQRR